MPFCNKKHRYSNPHIRDIHRNLWDVILWKFGFFDKVNQHEIAPFSFSYPVPDKPLNKQEPTLMWINHSTFLITIDNIRILTDPIWSKRCSPLSFIGPKRRHLPPIAIEDLSKIDYVIISHDHYDHLDKYTVLKLYELFPEIVWIVPAGVKKWFEKFGISNVFELSWWDEKDFTHFKVTAVPSQHFSGRRGNDLNQTLWMGCVLEFHRKEPKTLYFVGDTGYNSHDFKKIGERFPKIDLSLIPIGAYVPRKFMSPVHVEPHDAVRIHKEVHSRLSIGMHWKTFHLSDEPLHQPPYDLYLALQKEGIDSKSFLAIEPGHEINW